jgi:hypothetical protein
MGSYTHQIFTGFVTIKMEDSYRAILAGSIAGALRGDVTKLLSSLNVVYRFL